MTSIGKFGLLALFVVLAAVGTGAAFADAAETHTVENESMTVEYDATVAVDATDVAVSFADDVTVNNSSGATLLNETDYTWSPADGTVSWHDTNATVDSEAATITYQYDAQDAQTRGLAGIIRLTLYAGGVGILLVGGLVVTSWLNGLPGGGGR